MTMDLHYGIGAVVGFPLAFTYGDVGGISSVVCVHFGPLYIGISWRSA